MNIVCSPGGIAGVVSPKQGIMSMAKAGFKYTMLDFGEWCNGKDLEDPKEAAKSRIGNSWKAILENPAAINTEIQPYINCVNNCGLSTSVGYLEELQLEKDNLHLLEPFSELVKAYIRACGKCQCKYMILPPLWVEGEVSSMWELNKSYYMQFVEVAKEQNVMILLSNQVKDMNGHSVRGVCSNPYEAVSWIDELNAEVGKQLHENVEIFGLALDVVNCNVCGMDMCEYIKVLGSHIKAVFLSDSNGQEVASLLPFTCAMYGQHQTDWLGLIRGLRAIDFDGELIVNLADTGAHFPHSLRPQLVALAYSIAKYFKWQIEMERTVKKYDKIVLFGAGNMCLNYMQSFGKEHLPLFTCDNNSALWGTTFCGLEVKSPEELKNLPENCAVFICNMYYNEIAQQLREMGIKNPIEYYNDEYMPYFQSDEI